MFEDLDVSRLIYCGVAFVVILLVQLSRIKLQPALKSGTTKADKENDGEFEVSGQRGHAFNARIEAATKAKKG